MTDLEPILTLWQELSSRGSEYVLASVVEVAGSGYRKPGAMMLIAEDGRKTGTISGGCLEGEVARKAFWHTASGPVVQRYSTSADDGDVPFGMGCGGTIHVLLERSATAEPFLERLSNQFAIRQPLAAATVITGPRTGERSLWPDQTGDPGNGILTEIAIASFTEQRSFSTTVSDPAGNSATVRADFRRARPALFVFGAGDDAIPLVRQARQLGWYSVLSDGRSNLATSARFPEAHEVHVVDMAAPLDLTILPTDAAAVMSHSLEQDTHFLRTLLQRELSYIGVLGPRRRTEEILLSIALDIEPTETAAMGRRELWLEIVHAPMGLDLGGETPAEIALATIAEIQRTLSGSSGQALRLLRRLSRDTSTLSAFLSAD